MKWRNISGFDNYKVSEYGDVISKSRDIPMKTKTGEWITRKIKEKQLKKWLCNKGYYYVGFGNKNMAVARLVAMAFIPNSENKPEVNHIDNNPENNHYSNLEWCTRKENMAHAAKQGRIKTPNRKGSSHANAKLKEWQVLEAITRMEAGETSASVAKDYPVGAACLRAIKTNKALWRHIR